MTNVKSLMDMINKGGLKPSVMLMTKAQFDLVKGMDAMDVVKATAIGFERGKQLTAHIVNDGRVEDDVKRECGCGCPWIDDIFCLTCMRSGIFEVEANGRQDADFTNNIAAVFNRQSDDPTEDASVLWDAFEEGLSQGIDEVLEKMVPADRLMTMVMRANEITKALDAKKAAR